MSIVVNRAPVLTLWAAVVAERLGYAEPASFVNAFKRWHGTTPHASRLALRQQM